jgi:hypothetical protein
VLAKDLASFLTAVMTKRSSLDAQALLVKLLASSQRQLVAA